MRTRLFSRRQCLAALLVPAIVLGLAVAGQFGLGTAFAKAPQSNAAIVGITAPPTVQAGAPFNVAVTVRNAGPDTWTGAASYYLGTVNDSVVFGTGAQRTIVVGAVPPGGTTTFNVACVAPAAAGNYPLQLRMLQNGVNWFGGIAQANIAVTGGTVPQPPPAATAEFTVAVDAGDLNSVNLFITGPIAITDQPRQYRAKYTGTVPLRIVKSDIWAGIDAGMTPVDVHVEAVLVRTGCCLAKAQFDHYAEPNSSVGNVMVYDFPTGIALKPGDEIVYFANAFKGSNPRPGHFANRLTLWVTR